MLGRIEKIITREYKYRCLHHKFTVFFRNSRLAKNLTLEEAEFESNSQVIIMIDHLDLDPIKSKSSSDEKANLQNEPEKLVEPKVQEKSSAFDISAKAKEKSQN